MKLALTILTTSFFTQASAQTMGDTLPAADTSLRIINLNPYFTQNIDSVLVYQFSINKNPANYFWYLKNAPVGLSIGKDNGLVSFKAAKNYFLSGKLKYDFPYPVQIGVQNLHNPGERMDTSFSILFYNTEIVPSKLKPSVSGTIYANEGEPLTFTVQCETGSFPIETILFTSSLPIKDYKTVQSCGDEFSWTPPYDFVSDGDADKTKLLTLTFVGSTRFKSKDTALVQVLVRDALNYPLANETYMQVSKTIHDYVVQLKFAFLQLDKSLRKVKNTRTGFDLTAASTALTGTVLNTSSGSSSQRAGKILPSVGIALTPIKEATAPNKSVEQNQAALIRTSIKRLEYMMSENELIGDKDEDVLRKTQKLKEELKQVQVQMIDIPIEITGSLSEKELNDYFTSSKVNKKYRIKNK